jgi:hypothetical protein
MLLRSYILLLRLLCITNKWREDIRKSGTYKDTGSVIRVRVNVISFPIVGLRLGRSTHSLKRV